MVTIGLIYHWYIVGERKKKSINDTVKLQKPPSQFFEKYIINELQDIGLNYQFGKTNKKGSVQITVVVVW